jgi:hypothetical protein
MYDSHLKNKTKIFEHEMAICTPAIFGDERENLLPHLIEFYKKLGVTKIIAYSFDPSPQMVLHLKSLHPAGNFGGV